jgi:hypothetical protein
MFRRRQSQGLPRSMSPCHLYISKIGVLAFLSRITKKKTRLFPSYACYLLVAGLGVISTIVATGGCSWPSCYYWVFFANRTACDSQLSEKQQNASGALPSTNIFTPGYPLESSHSPRHHHRARPPLTTHPPRLKATNVLDPKSRSLHSLLPPVPRHSSLARPQRLYLAPPPSGIRRRIGFHDRHHLARSPAHLRPRSLYTFSAESFHGILSFRLWIGIHTRQERKWQLRAFSHEPFEHWGWY